MALLHIAKHSVRESMFTVEECCAVPPKYDASCLSEVVTVGVGGCIGSGGRWPTLYCAPGNAGIFQETNVLKAPIEDLNKNEEIVQYCESAKIDLVVVGPEAPLVGGLVDDLQDAGILAFGPSKSAARLEGSKSFMKDLCQQYNIPTGKYKVFTDPVLARDYVRTLGAPLVVKADGLAGGKGAIVCKELSQALDAVDRLLVNQCLGNAGASIIIEEYLEGEEASYFAFVDGDTVLPLTSAQDHKAVGEGDVGENTGGMGAYSPAPVVSPLIEEKILSEIIYPTARAMTAEGYPFKGVLFAGLMIHHESIQLLEYNVRFGDPECQCILMRMQTDLLDLILKSSRGELETAEVSFEDSLWAMTVVMASQGYPGTYQKGTVISLGDPVEDVKLFHAGTALNKANDLINVGGRVLGITSIGTTIQDVQLKAYKVIK